MNQSKEFSIRKALVDVAMHRIPATKVIRNGRWVCVQSGEIIDSSDIAIYDQTIAYIGPDAFGMIGEQTEVVQADGMYLVPGLLDGHMHIESGMLTVTEFVRAVVPHGTTGMFVDPHEIANVFGLPGVHLMVDEAQNQPVHVWVQMPSCVPSAAGFETSGAAITPDDVAEAMTWPGIVGLGEMMNFPGVFNNDPQMHSEMEQTALAGKVIGGHYASPDLGNPFHAYVAGGPEDDHEGTQLEDAVMRVRQGMKAMLRYGSGWKDVANQIKAVTERGLDPRRFILCTDDCHCGTLVNEGHVNRAVKQAILNGVAPITAIQMATLNTADHFGVTRQVGMLAPGRSADILLVSDLEKLIIEQVIAKGQTLVAAGKWTIDLPAYSYPVWSKLSVKLEHNYQGVDFKIPVPEGNQSQASVHINVIGIIENQAPTRHLIQEIPVKNGVIEADLTNDLAKVCVIERHTGLGGRQVGFVSGFGLNVPCAIASTVAHDAHNLIVIGTDNDSMALATNHLIASQGGQVVVKANQVVAAVDLPIAGLMSYERADIVAQKAKSILDSFRDCGCTIENPNMQLSLLALVVIPELRISDLGLVDVTRRQFIPLVER